MLYFRNGLATETDPRVPDEGDMVWLHLSDPDESTVHRLLGEMFGCHPLAIEDVLHFGQRPKLDHYPHQRDPQVFVTFYTIADNLHPVEVCMILSKQVLITVVREPIPLLDATYARALGNASEFPTPGAILYRLLDGCVDKYFHVLDDLENQVDKLEHRVFNHPEVRVSPEIFRLKRRVHHMRRWVSDGRNVVGMLAHESFSFADEQHQVYFVDVYDHASRIVDSLDAVRDGLSGLLDLQTAQRANRMNEVMKTLTIFSTIFLPLSFIVGLYGMNFHDIPELSWSFGYVYVWALMLAVTAAMLVYFKKKRWW